MARVLVSRRFCALLHRAAICDGEVVSAAGREISGFSQVLKSANCYGSASQNMSFCWSAVKGHRDSVRSIVYVRGLHNQNLPGNGTTSRWRNVNFFSREFSSKIPDGGPRLPGGVRERMMAQQKLSSEQGLYLVAIIVGMVGLTYAAVPLYRMFCQATGMGGTVKQGKTVEDKLRARLASPDEEVERAAEQREITVYFNADTADSMPWKFTPLQRGVKVRPGQSVLAFYNAYNGSDKAITGVSTYNVTPMKAGIYFNKIQCFCFEEQRLRPGENIDMPVLFYVDPEFATDKRMRGVEDLTLSYTFFKVNEDVETPAEALQRILAEHPDQRSGALEYEAGKAAAASGVAAA